MKAYTGMFKMRVMMTLQYRAAAWAGIVTQFFWGFMMLMVLFAFYNASDGASPMPAREIADYIWLGQAFLMMTMLWVQDSNLLKMISDGHVAYEFCRPHNLYPFWYARVMGMRLSYSMVRCIPIFVIAIFLPEPYRLHLPPDVRALGLFLLTFAMAALLVTAISMFVYLLTFLTLDAFGPRYIIGTIGGFFSGGLIPLPLMPDSLQGLLNFLPFRYIQDFPFRVYSGAIAGTDAVTGICVQIVWLLLLVALGYLTYGRIYRRVLIQGG